MSDLVERLWESDQASALTNEAARELEAKDKLIAELVEALERIVSEDDTGPMIYGPTQVGPHVMYGPLGGSEGRFAEIAHPALSKAKARELA